MKCKAKEAQKNFQEPNKEHRKKKIYMQRLQQQVKISEEIHLTNDEKQRNGSKADEEKRILFY